MRDLEALAPKPGEAIVRVECAGLGPMEVAAAKGLVDFAGTLGHEVVGVVEKLGSPRTHPELLGKRVALAPCIACARCDLCLKGLSAHCRERRVLGLLEAPGGLADCVTIPVRHLVEVPHGMDPQHVIFASAVADAVHVAHLVPAERHTYVTVLGDGASALLAAQVLAKRNAAVRLIGTREERFTLCERWSIRHRHIDEPGLRADQDVVVIAIEPDSGNGLRPGDAMRAALGMLRPRGTLVVQGPVVSVKGLALSLDDHLGRITRDEIRLLGARTGLLAEGIDAIRRGDVDLLPFISKRADLEEGASLLGTAASPEHFRTLVRVA